MTRTFSSRSNVPCTSFTWWVVHQLTSSRTNVAPETSFSVNPSQRRSLVTELIIITPVGVTQPDLSSAHRWGKTWQQLITWWRCWPMESCIVRTFLHAALQEPHVTEWLFDLSPTTRDFCSLLLAPCLRGRWICGKGTFFHKISL